ncbi:MAG: glycosyltransferase family 4 protein [Gammaproteobacteria bacterium]|nr:glycosyltransferase family 4 protein [Gammaproteobacteria bacterium]
MRNNKHTPLKVAILVRKFPNIVQTYVLNHILSLIKTGATILIIAERKQKHGEIHPRVMEHKLLDKTLYLPADLGNFFNLLGNIPFTNLNYLSKLRGIIFSNIWKDYGIKYGIKSFFRVRMLANQDIDIIHSHSLFSSYDYLFLKDYFSIPLTTTFHGLVPKDVEMLETDKIKTVVNISDAFFVNTKFARQQLLDFDCPIDKIHIIPQGTNLEDFPFKSRSITKDQPVIILSVGRLSIEKGFHVAIKGFASIAARYPNINYHIIGSGPEDQHLQEQINDSKLGDRVKIFGSVSTEELLSHYASAHIFILPSIDFRDGSHTETQGVVLQEAQSSGIPVIASRTGGIPEVIKDGETGLLCDEENHAQLSRHIESLISNSDLYQTLQSQARKDVEDNYSTDAICQRLIKVYNRILD